MFFANHQIRYGAKFSSDALQRTQLTREWSSKAKVLVCMCNPSKADDKRNDPSVAFLMKYFSTTFPQFGGLRVGNWISYRATDPKDMMAWLRNASEAELRRVIKHNLHALATMADDSALIVVAWGNLLPPTEEHYTGQVLDALSFHGQRPLYCFGTTGSGSPKHPMGRGKHRVPLTVKLVPYVPTIPLVDWRS